jgi:hypothetical protein
MKYFFKHLEWLLSKRKRVTSAGEARNKENSQAVDGNVN